MSQDLKISKKVYDKIESNEVFNKDISYFKDSTPTTIVNTPIQSIIPGSDIDNFFILYDQLFNEIPVEGTVNSHRYIVQRSSALLSEYTALEDIQPLLDEIARLRNELLDVRQELITLRLNTSGV